MSQDFTSQFNRWGDGLPQILQVGQPQSPYAEMRLTSADAREVYVRATNELIAQGQEGAPIPTVVPTYLVRPLPVVAATLTEDELAASGPVEVKVFKPSDAIGWMQVYETGQTMRIMNFQVGDWVIRVLRDDKFYAYVLGNAVYKPTQFSHPGAGYSSLLSEAGTDQDSNLCGAAATLLRSKGFASVNAAGANFVVAFFVSETLRERTTWGINLMLLDMLCRSQVAGGVLSFKQLCTTDTHGRPMHPIARGGGWKGDPPEMRMGLEDRIIMRWLRANKTELHDLDAYTTGIWDSAGDHWAPRAKRSWSVRRQADTCNQALHAVLKRRLTIIEALFGFELATGSS